MGRCVDDAECVSVVGFIDGGQHAQLETEGLRVRGNGQSLK